MTRNLSRNSRTCALFFLLGMTAALAGCSKKEPQPPPPKPAVAPKPAAPQPKPVQNPVSSAAKLAPPAVNQFDFSTKKDPFKPFAVVKAAPVPQARERVGVSGALPIHAYDVSQFRLIGIVTGGKDNHAMVVDPNGKGYVLKVGMTIGKNSGRVTAINTGGVQVLEQFRDDNGKVRKENIRIALPRKQ
jgi:type IV pilus assembly protein PilP